MEIFLIVVGAGGAVLSLFSAIVLTMSSTEPVVLLIGGIQTAFLGLLGGVLLMATCWAMAGMLRMMKRIWTVARRVEKLLKPAQPAPVVVHPAVAATTGTSYQSQLYDPFEEIRRPVARLR